MLYVIYKVFATAPNEFDAFVKSTMGGKEKNARAFPLLRSFSSYSVAHLALACQWRVFGAAYSKYPKNRALNC